MEHSCAKSTRIKVSHFSRECVRPSPPLPPPVHNAIKRLPFTYKQLITSDFVKFAQIYTTNQNKM